MAQFTEDDIRAIDVREKLAHIDQMLADHDRKRQEIRYAPWLAVITGLTAGAALFAAGAAFMKLLG
jgi:ABC-type Fe3+-siderophore transport system permease subunit